MEIKNKSLFIEFKRMWTLKPLFGTGIVLILMILLQTAALGFGFGSFAEWFNTWLRNWINILRNNAGIGIIALGMTYVIISGGIDLAVGSTLAAIGAVIMMLLNTKESGFLSWLGITGVPAIALTIILALAFGALLGRINGLLITGGKLPPFIATLGVMKILRSLTQYFMQGNTPAVPRNFAKIASAELGGFMFMPIIYWFVIAFLLHIVFINTAFGRQTIAIGSNEKAAKLSGVNVSRIKNRVYSLLGMLVAASAVLQVSRIGSMDFANVGSGYEMDAISAVIVGGARMSGGKGGVLGTVLGTLIIAVMNNLLNLIGVPPFLREAFKGVIVIGAVLLQKKDAAS